MTKRLLIVILMLNAMMFARAPLAGAQDCPDPTNTDTIRGELVEIEELDDEETDESTEEITDDSGEVIEPPDRYRAVLLLEEDETTREFLIIGKGDKIDIGSTYLATINEFDGGVNYTNRIAYLIDEYPCTEGSTILAVDDDGGTSQIDISGFDLPSFPVTPRQVATAFGALAVLTFIFREPRVNH